MKVKFEKEEIQKISEKIIKKILKKKTNQAKILALSGELGSGKTTLTQELAKRLGVKKYIISPTFVIMKIYEINRKSKYYKEFKKIIHIDAYRLESYKELSKIGWQKLVNDKDNLIIIEWPDRVIEILDKKNTNWIYLKHLNEETRLINF